MAEDVYVEPVTGRVYSTQDSPFLRVDLCWNHRNLWVNMQQIPVRGAAVQVRRPRQVGGPVCMQMTMYKCKRYNT